MQIIFTLIMTLFSLSAFSFSGRLAWQNADTTQKAYLINEYKIFIEQQNDPHIQNQNSVHLRFRLFTEAWAASLDCLYAGWPSSRINGYCSSPVKTNPRYDKGNCSSGQLQCQPMLFGSGFCVPVSTQEQRSGAFSACDNKFQESGKSSEDVVKEIHSKKKEKELLSFFDFADKICTTGAQKNSGMCRRLQAAVIRVQKKYNETKIVSPRKTEMLKLVKVAQKIAETTTDSLNAPVMDCKDCQKIESHDATVDGVPFERINPRDFKNAFGTYQNAVDGDWKNNFVGDDKNNLYPDGFVFQNLGPNKIAGAPIDPAEVVERTWNFTSHDNSRRETYLWVTDIPGTGKFSDFMETAIMIIPRKVQPAAKTVGDELHVTLTTGEKVIYDNKTHTIKSGVLKEGPVDTNPNRWNRKFADIKYSGTGLTIRTNKRGADPRLVTDNAIITQNGKTCSIPATQLWDVTTDFKFSDDSELVKFLNQKCTNKFSL